MNPAKILKMKKAWDTFTNNHPMLPKFLSAVKNKGLEEGTIIEMNITTTSGEVLKSNIKLTASDIELMKELQRLS
ncbi:hypothetical protein [Anaeromicropila herbilytica]|uniref:Uncharacterized protein n=1 Tax=Anaeromicropila herbilytica TaxID=2785025 RepID=A0A7R7EIJ2_9FIRM|nr:hypothetical protein [Anaeromicropila herbilytica]BCN29326.1 hypothetical protein bsdtb5_06210 [Anaeromicropila herbilytica]